MVRFPATDSGQRNAASNVIDGQDWEYAASLALLAELGMERRYRTGAILISEGDIDTNLFIVKTGAVRAYVEGPGGRTLTLSTYRAGEYVGEMALDGGPRSASIVTLEPTICSVVSLEMLRSHIHRDPEFALDLIVRLIKRARVTTASARGLALLDVYGRVRTLLEGESHQEEDGTRFISARLTHQEIANRVGASREMVTKILKELSVGGYVKIEQKQIRLLRTLPAGW